MTIQTENKPRPPVRIGVEGLACSLPDLELTNHELIERVRRHAPNLRTERCLAVASRLGIHTRRMVRDFQQRIQSPLPGQENYRLAARAVYRALEKAQVPSIGYLIGHTTTPHTLLPPNAAWIADELEYSGPFSELRQACTGFCGAVIMAHGIISSKAADRVAVVGSETGSVFFDPASLSGGKKGPTPGSGRDESAKDQLVNCVQMGDGAGACILSNSQAGAFIDHVFFGSAGLHQPPGLTLASGGSGRPWAAPAPDSNRAVITFSHDYSSIRTKGEMLFKRCIEAAENTGIDIPAADWILPHQANAFLGSLIGPRIGVSPSRFIVNFDTVGNLGSASIWTALAQACDSGRVKPGQTVLVLGAEATKYLYGGFLYHHA